MLPGAHHHGGFLHLHPPFAMAENRTSGKQARARSRLRVAIARSPGWTAGLEGGQCEHGTGHG